MYCTVDTGGFIEHTTVHRTSHGMHLEGNAWGVKTNAEVQVPHLGYAGKQSFVQEILVYCFSGRGRYSNRDNNLISMYLFVRQ